MSSGGWAAIEGMISSLREIAHADRADWLLLKHRIEELPVVRPSSPAPIELQLMAAAAKGIVRQMPGAPDINEQELRGICQALAVVMKNHMDLVLAQEAQNNAPYYLKGDR